MTEALARFLVPGNPVGKPRMTRRDRWQARPRVVAYRAWADRARIAAAAVLARLARDGAIPGRVRARAYFALPASWSARKRARLTGAPHRTKPDADNVLKSCLDALFARDQVVYDAHLVKLWDDGQGPRLEVELGE